MTSIPAPEARGGPSAEADSQFYAALVSHFLHQDQLLWGRVQTLIAVQGAILAGAYAFHGTWIAPTTLVLGALLTAVLWRVAHKDGVDRDINQDVMDELAAALVQKNLPRYSICRGKRKTRSVQMSADQRDCLKCLSPRNLIYFTILLFLIIDVLFAGLHVCYPNLLDTKQKASEFAVYHHET